ncbi:hypothetical protein WJX72_010136 [[Myrmecia] bisecta]|uniref:shikimate dehydrogenase (NADP(+)) n=1 Tax=[Myrmecia] bisecta TaxID=41462 RepID=A0AAW1Q885_9CHLO
MEPLLQASPLPKIVTFRPAWEGGRYLGDEAPRLAALKYAALLGAEYIDVEYLASDVFLAGGGTVPITTKIILSHHDYEKTPDALTLETLLSEMFASGADVAKIATTALDISDSMRVLQVLGNSKGPTIALAMGERGLPTRLLAPKFGGHLTFGALGAGRESAPGQPTVQQLRQMFRLQDQTAATKVYGIVGNPVSHSRSPAVHNAAMAAVGFDAVYIPLLVDDMKSFLEAFNGPDFGGFSVTIPHKLAALECADAVDGVAQQIGAVNTLVRQEDGSLKGYNTDWSAAIDAIADGLRTSSPEGASPLQGLRVVVVGAGGAGRALAFGASDRGAQVVIANRNRARAEELAASMPGGAEVVDLEDLASGAASGDVLVNTTAVGMHPQEDETPVQQGALKGYKLVFDAVYTPLQTRLLREAEAQGCLTVSGLEMFVGQAAQQFELFTGQQPPVELMRQAVIDSLKQH